MHSALTLLFESVSQLLTWWFQEMQIKCPERYSKTCVKLKMQIKLLGPLAGLCFWHPLSLQPHFVYAEKQSQSGGTWDMDFEGLFP